MPSIVSIVTKPSLSLVIFVTEYVFISFPVSSYIVCLSPKYEKIYPAKPRHIPYINFILLLRHAWFILSMKLNGNNSVITTTLYSLILSEKKPTSSSILFFFLH